MHGPFEFRITEKVPDDIGNVIPLRWQRWMRDNYGDIILMRCLARLTG